MLDLYGSMTTGDPLSIGLVMGCTTLGVTAFLELLSLSAARRVLKQAGGAKLYRTAIAVNILNNAIMGPIIYAIAVNHFCAPEQRPAARACSVVGMLIVQSIGYYIAHASMHRPELYRFHKLHHKFHTNVTPVAANCVGIVEYVFAYMLPLVAGIGLFRPDRHAVMMVVNWVSFTNLLIHTPSLEAAAEKLLPWCFVGTHDHLEHHKRLTTKYAAPTFCVDRLIDALMDAVVGPKRAEQLRSKADKKA